MLAKFVSTNPHVGYRTPSSFIQLPGHPLHGTTLRSCGVSRAQIGSQKLYVSVHKCAQHHTG